MPNRVLVFLAEGFEEIEAITVIDILRRAGIKTDTAGLNSLKIKGAHEISLTADILLDDADPCAYSACVLPGGMPGAKNLAESSRVKTIIKEICDRNGIIAAICASPAIVLAPAGILENKSATCYPGLQKAFSEKTKYKEENVVIDNNIITSRGPAQALEFALAIVEKIKGKKEKEKAAAAMLAA